MTYLRSYAAVLISTGPWRLALAVGLMVVGSLSEGVGIAVLIAVLSAAGLEVGGQGAVADLARDLAPAAIGGPVHRAEDRDRAIEDGARHALEDDVRKMMLASESRIIPEPASVVPLTSRKKG